MGVVSEHLKYGESTPGTNPKEYLSKFIGKPLHVWVLSPDGDISKYVVEDVNVTKRYEDGDRYLEVYKWTNPEGYSVSCSSAHLGEVYFNMVVTFVDDDEAVLDLIEHEAVERIRQGFEDFNYSNLSDTLDRMRNELVSK